MTSWIYKQSSGYLYLDELYIATGYSGYGLSKNYPPDEVIVNKGPIPCGMYTIGPPFDSKLHGPYVLRLTPSSHNTMYNRAGFLIHGDSIKAPGTASHGCIIMSRAIRERMYLSVCLLLTVVP